MTVAALTMTWIALKLVAMWGWVFLPDEYGDTYYYFLVAEERLGAAAFPEYPTPAALLLNLPYLLGVHDYENYRLVIMISMTAADAAFAVLLGRLAGPISVLGWMILTTALGQVALLRFDMLPAVVAAAALLLAMNKSNRASMILVTIGVSLKVWPIILIPLLLMVSTRRKQALAWLGGSGLILLIGALLAGGSQRLWSPLIYQTERGLQIEAIAATPSMRAWAIQPGFAVAYSPFRAYEVTGPGVPGALAAVTALTIAAFIGWIVLVVWWIRRGSQPAATPYLAMTGIGAFLVTSAALSPQYLLWIAAPTAVLLGLRVGAGSGPAPYPAQLTWMGVIVICLLTTAIYPVNYAGLFELSPTTPRVIALLTLRNILLVIFVLWSAAVTWVLIGVGAPPRQRHRTDASAPDPARSGPSEKHTPARLEPAPTAPHPEPAPTPVPTRAEPMPGESEPEPPHRPARVAIDPQPHGGD